MKELFADPRSYGCEKKFQRNYSGKGYLHELMEIRAPTCGLLTSPVIFINGLGME